MRGPFNTSLVWANEVAEYSLTSLAFIGGAIAYHRGLHLVVRFGVDKLPDSWRESVECARHYFVIVVALIGLRYALPMWQDAWTNLTVVLQIPKSWTLLPFFIGMGLTVVFALAELRRHTSKENIVAALGVGCCTGVGLVPGVRLHWPLAGYVRHRLRVGIVAVPGIRRCTDCVRALPELMVPIILIIGIVGGFATTTEVSSIAVVFSIVVSVFIYRGMNFKSFITTLADSAAMAGMVLFTVSAGSAFSWTLAVSGLQSVVGEFLMLLGGSPFAFVTFSIVLMVVMGSILEGLPSLLIFGPMLLQLTKHYGIDPMAFGIVIIIIAMGIGTFIPPFGVCYFVTCSVMDTTVEKMTPRFLPYLAVLLIGLVCIALFPAISLALPHAFGLR